MSLPDRVLGLIARGVVETMSGAAAKLALIKGTLLSDDTLPGVAARGWYGFASRAKAGAEFITLAIGGSADDLVAISVDDRRYRIALEEGEVALYDDLGHKVLLGRDGIVIDAGSIKLGATASLGVARSGDGVRVDDALFTAWVTAVTTYLNGLGAALPTAQPRPTGIITSGSAKVTAA